MADTPETPPTKSTRRLTIVRTGDAAANRDVVKPVRAWWARTRGRLHEVPQVTMGQAMMDVAKLALAELAAALTDPKTSARERRRIALAMGPKLAVQVVGKGNLVDAPPSRAGHDVLDAYAEGPTAPLE